MSDDGTEAITLIAFIGSVFSPYYAWARRRGPTDPARHCALNVALYRRGGKRWALTERDAGALRRTRDCLAIGPSALCWDSNVLEIRIEEITAPIPSRIRGVVRVRPAALPGHPVSLDAAGQHRWSPLAPVARVEVALSSPALRWSGRGYLDSNDGDAPLERDFLRWDWSCARLQDGAAVLYEVTPRDGPSPPPVAFHFDGHGAVTQFAPPPPCTLPRTLWRVPRATRSEDGAAIIRTLEDAPFYARSLISTRLFSERVDAMHESLSLDRFRAPWVQAMLPFRIPRRWF